MERTSQARRMVRGGACPVDRRLPARGSNSERVRGAYVAGSRAGAGRPAVLPRPVTCADADVEAVARALSLLPGAGSRPEWTGPGSATPDGAPGDRPHGAARPGRRTTPAWASAVPCVPQGRLARYERTGGARRLAGEARTALADRVLVFTAVALGSAVVVVVLGLLAQLAGAR